jgi:hypothetical protein
MTSHEGVPVQYLRAGEAPNLTGGLEAEIGGLLLFLVKSTPNVVPRLRSAR